MSLARKVLAHVTRNPIRYSIGGVLALVFGGVYLYRRRQAKQLGGDLGATDLQTLRRAAHRQVVAARAKSALTDYRKAEDQQLFYAAPTDVEQAHAKAAYWLAVAARCSQEWSLVDLADQEQRASTRTSRLLPSKTITAISTILSSAGDAIRAVAPSNPGAKAAAAALGSLADPGKIATKQQAARDNTITGKLVGTAKGSAEDVTEYAEKALDVAGALSNGVRMLLGMDPPPGGPADAWWNWKKWALRGGVAAAVILGVRVMFAPEYHAAKAVVIKAGSAVQNPVAAIRAALTTSGV